MENRKPTKFYVEYNGSILGLYKSLSRALNLIKRKGWKDDEDNSLYLFDDLGNAYNPQTGENIGYVS